MVSCGGAGGLGWAVGQGLTANKFSLPPPPLQGSFRGLVLSCGNFGDPDVAQAVQVGCGAKHNLNQRCRYIMLA